MQSRIVQKEMGIGSPSTIRNHRFAPKDGFFDAKDALKKLREKWLDELHPYGEHGYNIRKPDKN